LPKLAVIIAGLCILAAGLYGGLRGFDFTDLDQTTPELPAQTVVKAETAAPPVAPPVLDERTVRELARAEVRQVIRPAARPAARAPAASPAAAAQPGPAAETPSSEPIAAEPAVVGLD
jgi:hypothetical protein